jgi:hypothetical protein
MDDTSEETTTNTTDRAAALEVDYGIGRIYVQGDKTTDFDEVVAEFNAQKADMIDTIEELKEFDYELREKYEDAGGSTPTYG